MWVSWCKNKSFWQRFTCNTEKKEEVVATVPTPAPVTSHAKKGSNKKKRKRKLGTGTGPDPQGLESSSKASSVCGGRASKTGSKVDFYSFLEIIPVL